MRIGIDIDECVVYIAQDILDIINERNGTKYFLDDIPRYNIEEYLDVPESEVMFAIQTAILGEPRLIEYADIVINWLSTYANIFFVTKRKIILTEPKHTKSMLERLGLNYPLIMGREKVEVVKEIELDYMIEDRAKTVEEIVDNTPCTCLLLDKPWNRHTKDHKRIIKVNNWTNIFWYFSMKTKGYK